MPRIPTAEISRFKQEVDLAALVRAKGIELQPHGTGGDLVGCCPFHDDRTPSLVVSPRKNLWNCLGACQAGGDVFQWVMKVEGVSFRHAYELLKEGLPGVGVSGKKYTTDRRLDSPVSFDGDDQAAIHQVLDYYHERLKAAPEALDYLAKRGLTHSKMIDRFKLGFADRTLGLRLPAKVTKHGAEVRGRLQQIGLLRKTGHEHFNGCIVFPIMDAQDRITEIYGRRIDDSNRAKGTGSHWYLPGPHQGIFNASALAMSAEMILCESIIDALTFWCAGYRNVTATYGNKGFTDDHIAAFRAHGTKRLFLAYDRDESGEKAAANHSERLVKELSGVSVYRIQFPKGMDANEYALKVQPANQSLGLTIRKAEWMAGTEPHDPAAPSVVDKAEPAAKQKIIDESPTVPLLAASPHPPKSPEIDAQIKPEEIIIPIGDRRYRIRGLAKNLSFDQLKVNVLASRGDAFHVDTLDLYSARPRSVFVSQVAEELGIEPGVIKKDLGSVLLKLEELQEKQINETLKPKEATVTLSDPDKTSALDLLKDPKLLDRILDDFDHCGVVGEKTNKLIGYLAAVSRKLDKPLAVVIQSSSAAGKSSLMDAVLSLMPPEEVTKYSAMTGQSLFYMDESNLKHKILAIAEEEGAEQASYALKLLQSEGELAIASTGKDPQTGRHKTERYQVEGPVMIFLTTTSHEVDEELLNRCLVLTVDEERAQTRAIHQCQRQAETLEGLLSNQRRHQIVKLHQNVQRLLQPLPVVNPYANELTFMDNRTRTRRDHVKYLTLIRTLALLHQHQRPRKTAQRHDGTTLQYIEVTRQDIQTADRLARDVLSGGVNELPPRTRTLLDRIEQMVTEASKALKMNRQDYRFTRREVREYCGYGQTQLKAHIRRLEDLEYLTVHRAVGRAHRIVYGLSIDQHTYNGRWSGSRPSQSGGGRYTPPTTTNSVTTLVNNDSDVAGRDVGGHGTGDNDSNTSYRTSRGASDAA